MLENAGMGPRLEHSSENGELEMQLGFGCNWNLRWKWWGDIEWSLKYEFKVHREGQGKCDFGIHQWCNALRFDEIIKRLNDRREETQDWKPGGTRNKSLRR